MKLADLIDADITVPAGATARDVTGLAADSRKVAPGMVFAALAGSKTDGAKFIADAAAKGAAAILAPPGTAGVAEVPVLEAREPRQALAKMAARFYARQPETIVAVTGTNGKTSVADFTRQLYAALGREAASLGTIGVVKPDGAVYGSLTTPDPITLHATLADLANEGVTHLAFEASSHGLDQFRIDGVRLAAAAFTNLGRDHLDYHPTIEDYLAAKLRLFKDLLAPGQPAIVNADGPRASDVIAVAQARGLALMTTGTTGETLKLVEARPDGFAQRLVIQHAGQTYRVRLGLMGDYQASNALVAAALVIATGETPSTAIRAIETLEGVRGRLDIAGTRRGGIAVVDYAHKPEALAAALDALRPFATGRLICVFGCGGDRDRGKRPIMGRIAVEKADVVIVTDDNPRTEVPAVIRAEILADAPGAREIAGRAAAIRAGVALLGKGDVLLVAGKGHENGQIIGSTTIPFSDHDEVRAALEAA